ncbi:MAG: hypothetical protein GY906_00915 [bacterium]|nr:hypothetical protein [bacterium]
MSIKPHDDRPATADWHTLGLEPGASRAEVQRAYRHRHALYSPDSLAIYGLIDDTERCERLQHLDAAYQRILAYDEPRHQLPTATPNSLHTGPSAGDVPKIEATIEALRHPGAFLREVRLAKGLTLEDISMETKIRSSIIDILEDERFTALPERVFVRGFVIQLARSLGIRDPEDVAKKYLELAEATKDE